MVKIAPIDDAKVEELTVGHAGENVAKLPSDSLQELPAQTLIGESLPNGLPNHPNNPSGGPPSSTPPRLSDFDENMSKSQQLESMLAMESSLKSQQKKLRYVMDRILSSTEATLDPTDPKDSINLINYDLSHSLGYGVTDDVARLNGPAGLLPNPGSPPSSSSSSPPPEPFTKERLRLLTLEVLTALDAEESIHVNAHRARQLHVREVISELEAALPPVPGTVSTEVALREEAKASRKRRASMSEGAEIRRDSNVGDFFSVSLIRQMALYDRFLFSNRDVLTILTTSYLHCITLSSADPEKDVQEWVIQSFPGKYEPGDE